MKKFALAGNPNSGKTTLFNSLTGSTAHVGNWPGVTVDKKEGTYKKLPEPITLVDLPGIYSLSPYTPEEVVSRNFLLDEFPDCIINIVDATNLERNLYLTTQLMEIDVPIIVALNMMDEVEKNGDKIDVKKLEEKMGVPVVAISALREKGLDELMARGYETCLKGRKASTVLASTELMHLIGDCRIALEGQGVDNALFHAVKLVELDSIESEMHPTSVKMVEEFKKVYNDEIFGSDFEAIIADARYKYITKHYSIACEKHRRASGESKSDKIDKVLTHKVWGIPIFLVIMFFIFHFTFSEDLFFLGAFGVFDNVEMTVIEQTISGNAIEEYLSGVTVNSFFGYETGVYSIGVILFNAVDILTGLISTSVEVAMTNAPVWLTGLLIDGVLGGLFSVLSFLPQIIVLFMFFSILEDSGYMARVAFILDRLFKKFGLSGRAFMPMIMGFGCSVPAMVNTRTLADQNERTATIRVIPFFSCGAKLPILTAIAGGIVQLFGIGNADIITYGMYVIGIATAIISVILMRKTTMKGEVPPFIMELPAYRLPQLKSLLLHLWDKAKHFIEKAFTIILASTVIIWFISHFSWFWEFLPDERVNESILAGIGGLVQPLFTPLGFGSQLSSSGWVFVVAVVTGLIAKENVIATFGTLGACIAGAMIDVETDGGVSAVIEMITATGITVPGLIAFIAFNMTTIPCMAAVATAKAELPTKKSFIMTLIFWVVASYLLSTMIYLIGTWWWTVFIFLAVWAVIILLITLENKGVTKMKKFFSKIYALIPDGNKSTKSSAKCSSCASCSYSSTCATARTKKKDGE